MPFVNLNDDHVTPSAELFLDTSIHCSKLKGPLFRERIGDVFRLFQWKSTSTYTKVEFGNVVLSTAEYFLRKLEEFNSLEAAQDFIGNVLPHRLHPTKVTWSFNLLKAFGADDAECTECELSLRRLMKLGVAFVEQLCDRPLANGTDCYWAKRGVHKRQDGRLVWQTPKCSRGNKRCRLDDFFGENIDVFKRIKDAVDKSPEDATVSSQETHTNSGEPRESGRDLDGWLGQSVLLLVEEPVVCTQATAISQEAYHACPRRNETIRPDEVGYYHCFNRCVRRAFLCGVDLLTGNDYGHRKTWIRQRLETLAAGFAVEVCGVFRPWIIISTSSSTTVPIWFRRGRRKKWIAAGGDCVLSDAPARAKRPSLATVENVTDHYGKERGPPPSAGGWPPARSVRSAPAGAWRTVIKSAITFSSPRTTRAVLSKSTLSTVSVRSW